MDDRHVKLIEMNTLLTYSLTHLLMCSFMHLYLDTYMHTNSPFSSIVCNLHPI